MTKLYLSRLHYPVTALGPGNRIGIWFQGCSLRCPGCISADTWTKNKGETDVNSVFKILEPWLLKADGITISGGEPFEQPSALRHLLLKLHDRFEGDILVYTGFEFDQISNWFNDHHTPLIDSIITGPYQLDQPQTMSLRGSDNQQLHYLTDLGRRRFQPYHLTNKSQQPSLDMMFDEDGSIWFAGIPHKGDFEKLSTLLQNAGHEMFYSGDRSHLRRR